jgi:tetratricopeptide (TPR) repeat protein
MAALVLVSGSGRADVCQPCTGVQVEDPKLHGRSLKSYWGVAHATKPPDKEVLDKAYTQGHLALCGQPDQWEWNMFMGMLSAEMEKFKEAGCYFGEAIKYSEGKDQEKVVNNRGSYWVEHYNKALDYFKKEAYDAAITEADIAVSIAPDSCKAYNIKGSALSKLERQAEAIPTLKAGLVACPQHEALKTNLFNAYLEQGDLKYREAGSVKEDSARTRLLNDAVTWYRGAEEIKPGDPNVQYQYGSALAQLAFAGDSTQLAPARDQLVQFLGKTETKEDKLAVLYQLSMLEIEAKDYAKAGEYCDQFLAGDPRDADGYRLKANIIRMSGDATKAESYIILYNGLARGKVVNADSLKGTPKYAASDLGKVFTERGSPEEFRSYTDSSGNNMDSAFYWSKGQAIAFYGGQKRGEVSFTPESQ